MLHCCAPSGTISSLLPFSPAPHLCTLAYLPVCMYVCMYVSVCVVFVCACVVFVCACMVFVCVVLCVCVCASCHPSHILTMSLQIVTDFLDTEFAVAVNSLKRLPESEYAGLAQQPTCVSALCLLCRHPVNKSAKMILMGSWMLKFGEGATANAGAVGGSTGGGRGASTDTAGKATATIGAKRSADPEGGVNPVRKSGRRGAAAVATLDSSDLAENNGSKGASTSGRSAALRPPVSATLGLGAGVGGSGKSTPTQAAAGGQGEGSQPKLPPLSVASGGRGRRGRRGEAAVAAAPAAEQEGGEVAVEGAETQDAAPAGQVRYF